MDSNLEARRPRWYRRRWGIAVLTLVGALAVAVPVAWASHDFADVPTEHQFHTQISAIKGAGITTGCGGGNYCPDEFVRRDAMAAFMHRGFGRTGNTFYGANAVPATGNSVVATRTITPGAVAPGTGFIKADAQVTVYVDSGSANGCPCTVYAYLRRADGAAVSQVAYASLASSTIGAPGWIQTMGLTGVVASGSSPTSIQLVIGRYSGTGTVTTFGGVTASYFPFGPTGTNAASGAGASPATAPLPAPGH